MSAKNTAVNMARATRKLLIRGSGVMALKQNSHGGRMGAPRPNQAARVAEIDRRVRELLRVGQRETEVIELVAAPAPDPHRLHADDSCKPLADLLTHRRMLVRNPAARNRRRYGSGRTKVSSLR